MTSTTRGRQGWYRPGPRVAGVLLGAAALLAGTGAVPAAQAASAPTVTAPPYSCAPNGPAGNQTVYGTFGDASVLGWTGNHQAVPACLGGSFFVISGGQPGSGATTPVTGTTYGYGVYDDSTTTWTNADGYLPALVTTFDRDGARISITNFGDKVTAGGHAYVAIYSRVQVTNPTGQALSIDPQASAGLIPLNQAGDTVPAHGSVNHDYVVAADRFGGSYAWPSASALAGAGGYDQHFAHMRAYWNQQLAGIAQIVSLPDASLADAYRTGFIYTQILRSGNELRTGANGYDTEFSHDVIGILANLFTQGYTANAHGLLLRARHVSGNQPQYLDGVWTWAAPFLFGRWAWDGSLFGAPLSGPGVSLIDATYTYGFARLAGKLPPDTFGGYPAQYFSTAYNAGYGEWGLASSDYRSQGIASYQFMIANGQNGPYSWWESQQFPNPGSPWTGVHPEAGNGSSPHAWGIANANMTLLDSLAAQRSDGSLMVGRGVPDAWLRGGQAISVANFPTTDGRHLGLTIRPNGLAITLSLTGAAPAGPVLFQLPAFVNNIAHASTGTVDQKTGTVTLASSARSVTVQLRR